ncbi:MAG: glycosyltransferase family 39 protein, partial [Candidatus Eisenbacteria bacterium]|nr:glycosyltransferase family 39 protein [Candidatus Eisenbacteria bacterium]
MKPEARNEVLAASGIFVIAAILLFWGLGSPYLWQDEAATAVLGERLLATGRPLAYDGTNLIAMDSFSDEDPATIGERTRTADASLRYLIARGDFRSDLAWTGQPWGQFFVAGASLAALGHRTAAARIPFAIAGLLTVLILWRFAHRLFQDPWMAALAPLFLATNTYWVLHARQCRYYALSGLFLLLTVVAFRRWMDRARAGAVWFVLAAWCWFQVDFGTFWPIVGLLGVVALSHTRGWGASGRASERASRGKPITGSGSAGSAEPVSPTVDPSAAATKTSGRWAVLGTFGVLLAGLAPWVWYYQLFGRYKEPAISWIGRAVGNLFHVNQFLIAVPVWLLAAFFWWRRTRQLRAGGGEPARATETAALTIVFVALVSVPLLYLWVTAVTPWYFYRYFVALTPLTALL